MKKRLALLIVLVAIVVIALLWWRENRRYDGPVQQVTANAEQLARGRYLVQAADCAACQLQRGIGSVATWPLFGRCARPLWRMSYGARHIRPDGSQ